MRRGRSYPANVRRDTFQLTHPTRDATLRRAKARRVKHYFNSRTPRGMRHRMLTYVKNRIHFNSRTPRGMRQCRSARICVPFNFNSRTPRGMRLYILFTA